MVNLCNKGQQQSPVNILTDKTLECSSDQCHLTFYYKPSDVCDMQNINDKVIINYPKGSYVIYNLDIFHLERVAFMLPSSHAIDNKKSKVEMQLYHRSDKNKLLVISVLINVTNEESVNSNFFEMFLHHLPTSSEVEKQINMKGRNWNIFYALPKNKDFYSYNGSILYVPCTENVQWLIMEERVSMTELAYERLKLVNKVETRNLKKLFKRKVFHTVSNNDFNFLVTHKKSKKKIVKKKIVKKEDNTMMILLYVFIGLIVLGIVLFIVSKFRKNKQSVAM